MAGPDYIDGNTVPVSLGDPAQIKAEKLAVAWCDGDGKYPVRADLVTAVENAARALASEGSLVAELRPPGLENAEDIYAALRSLEGLPEHRRLAVGREAELTDYVTAMMTAAPQTNSDARELTATADRLRAEVYGFMQDWPILLMPVASVPAFRPGADRFTIGGITLTGLQIEACCRVVTLLKAPVAVVRCGYSEEGLPAGIQVVGRPFHDAETVAVAAVLEDRFQPAQAPPRTR